jgi:hypothetical protein
VPIDQLLTSEIASYDLANDDGLRAACEAIGHPDKWGDAGKEWTRRPGRDDRVGPGGG